MHTRHFLGTAALAGAAPVFAQQAAGGKGPALLTVTGAIVRPNRGPFDPALDQMMHEQKVTRSPTLGRPTRASRSCARSTASR